MIFLHLAIWYHLLTIFYTYHLPLCSLILKAAQKLPICRNGRSLIQLFTITIALEKTTMLT